MERFGTAIILAGGQSTRMGFDKQLLDHKGQPLTVAIANRLKGLFSEIIIVTNRPYLYGQSPFAIVADQYQGKGPLGGIHAGLKKSRSQYSYITACDMPYVNLGYIEYMGQLLAGAPLEIKGAVTRFGPHIEPLNSFYSKDLLATIENNLIVNNKKITSILEEEKFIIVDEQIARQFSPHWEMFMNLNTPADAEYFKNRWVGY